MLYCQKRNKRTKYWENAELFIFTQKIIVKEEIKCPRVKVSLLYWKTAFPYWLISNLTCYFSPNQVSDILRLIVLRENQIQHPKEQKRGFSSKWHLPWALVWVYVYVEYKNSKQMHSYTHYMIICLWHCPDFVKFQYSVILFGVMSLKKSSVILENYMSSGKQLSVSLLRISDIVELELKNLLSYKEVFQFI